MYQPRRYVFPLKIITLLLSLSLASEFLGAQVADPDKLTIPVPTEDFAVTVTDESGDPIEGVRVTPNGLRVEEFPGTHYSWPARNVGKPRSVRTDAQGKASFKFPPKFGKHPDWVHTNVITYSVEHPEFISRRVESSVDAKSAIEEMVPGCELIASAIDPNREVIENLSVMIAGNSPRFVSGDLPGEIRSRSIPRGRRQTMLVSADQENGNHLFSSVRSFPFTESKKVTLRGLTLRPGMEILGKLSDEVDRPVNDGFVIAWSIPKPDGPVNHKERASIGWRDVADIQSDGTFHFPSLPKGGKLQVIAICDGWLIDGRRRGSIIRGITYDLNDVAIVDDLWDGLEIPMKRAASVAVKLLKPDGSPLVGATVYTCPNQAFDLSGSQILGDVYCSADLLNKDSSRLSRADVRRNHRYTATTDDRGICHLNDMPLGNQSVVVLHDEYQVPGPASVEREFNFVVDAPGEMEVTIDVELIPQDDK
jgi:hypothetical protein